jgi:hypothetical protein
VSTVAARLGIDPDALKPERRTLLVLALLVNTEILLTVGYLLVSDAIITQPRYLVYPWLWVNAAVLAVWRTDRPRSTDGRLRYQALAVAGVYGLVLAVAGGLVGLQPGLFEVLAGDGHLHGAVFGAGLAGLSLPLGSLLSAGAGVSASLPSLGVPVLHTGTEAAGFVVHLSLPPGMGPAVLYQGAVLRLVLLPYEVVGYAALSYLVYVGVLESAGSTVSGVVGLFSCVSCAWPVVGAVVTTLFGSGSAVALAATTWPYDLSTLVFLSAVGLLYWRPSW